MARTCGRFARSCANRSSSAGSFILPPSHFARIALPIRRQLAQRGDAAIQLRQSRAIAGFAGCRNSFADREHQRNRLRIDGQHFVEVLHDQACRPRRATLDMSRLQILAVRISQDRDAALYCAIPASAAPNRYRRNRRRPKCVRSAAHPATTDCRRAPTPM